MRTNRLAEPTGVTLLLLLSAVLSASPAAAGAFASLSGACPGHVRWLDARALAARRTSRAVLNVEMTGLRTSRVARVRRSAIASAVGTSAPAEADLRAGLLNLPPPMRL